MTRIILSIVVFISVSTVANAQFTKGSLVLGGSLGYSDFKSTSNNPTDRPETKYTGGIFNINLGKAIRENAVVGINLSYSHNSQNNYYTGNTGSLDYSRNTYTIGVFYRLYKSLGKDFYFFAEGSASYLGSTESGKDELGVKQLSGSGNGGIINVYPGISYKVSKRFLMELSIPTLFSASYTSSKTNSGPIVYNKISQFDISSSLGSNPLQYLGIGFHLIL